MTKVTHFLAGALVAAAAFVVSPAGQALVVQYPKLSLVVSLITALAALYHNPKAG